MTTKKALKVIPENGDYVVISNQISRAAHDLSVMQARLVYLAMAQVRPNDTEFPVVEMTVGDIVRALQMNDQGNRYAEIRAATRGVMKAVLDIDTPDGWEMFHWFSKARYIKARDAIQIQFAEELHPYILALQKAFSLLTIADLSRLQGRYALRIFEIVMSFRGMAGTADNKPECWYVDLEFDHLRNLFKMGPNEYKDTKNFRVRIIDGPVREINEADLGLRIDCDYQKFRRGRRLLGVRLLCQNFRRDSLRPVHPATRDEQDENALIAANQAAFDSLLAHVKARPELGWASSGMQEMVSRAEAIKLLKKTLTKGGNFKKPNV